MLKILSWNIRQGGGSRISQITKHIQESSSHILVLSEFRNNEKGIILRSNLLKMGYRFQLVSNSPKDENSVIIASNIPFNGKVYIGIDETYSGNILKAKFPAFDLIGCYLPHKKKHRLFDFLREEAQSEKPIIITGDLNTGINGLDQKGSSFWYEDDLKQLDKDGVKDLFRTRNGMVEEYSWISHQGNGYRYDHFYGSEALIPVIKNCYYDHKVREDGISDHSVMILEMG